MEMTPDEILMHYKQAKDKRKQIRILADLNNCSEEDVCASLLAAGIDKRALPRSRKQKSESLSESESLPEEKAPAEEPVFVLCIQPGGYPMQYQSERISDIYGCITTFLPLLPSAKSKEDLIFCALADLKCGRLNSYSLGPLRVEVRQKKEKAPASAGTETSASQI